MAARSFFSLLHSISFRELRAAVHELYVIQGLFFVVMYAAKKNIGIFLNHGSFLLNR